MHAILAADHAATTLQTLYYAGGALAGAVTLATIGRRLGPSLRRRVHRWDRLDLMLGDPDSTPPRPGVLERVEELTVHVAGQDGRLEELGRLAAELVPNHGSSYRDEYRRDRDHQHAVNQAIAEKLGIRLPAHPHREEGT